MPSPVVVTSVSPIARNDSPVRAALRVITPRSIVAYARSIRLVPVLVPALVLRGMKARARMAVPLVIWAAESCGWTSSIVPPRSCGVLMSLYHQLVLRGSSVTNASYALAMPARSAAEPFSECVGLA